MIILGVILAIVGWLVGFAILLYIGIILIVVGLVLMLADRSGRTVGGRAHWF